MKNWSRKRRLSFWVHLVYVLVPSTAALVASVTFWTWLFGSPWFAVPLIVSLEGVAAIGLFFRLRGISSPFQTARHFIPLFSVGTLGYELFSWLNDRHGVPLAVVFTVFIVGVFGTLFVQSFNVLERLVIDPVEAAEERAAEIAAEIEVPVAANRAASRVYGQIAQRIMQDRARAALTIAQAQGGLLDVEGLELAELQCFSQGVDFFRKYGGARVQRPVTQQQVQEAVDLDDSDLRATPPLPERPATAWDCRCDACGGEMSPGAKGVATKQAHKFGGKLLCTGCRRAIKA